MNQKIGLWSSVINLIAVVSFAVSMLFAFDFGSYFSSMIIALSFLPMVCSHAFFSKKEYQVAGFVSTAFAALYAVTVLWVYFAQVTTVRMESLSEQTSRLLDFQQFGLFFNYDLLGYALMALATFFAGLTIDVQTKPDKWLKALLLIHGIFFVSCFIMPMLGLFKANSPAWVGTAVLEFWCLYFCPISVLSALHFSRCKTQSP